MSDEPFDFQLQQINIRLYVLDIEEAKKIGEQDYTSFHKILREATKIGMQHIKKKRGKVR